MSSETQTPVTVPNTEEIVDVCPAPKRPKKQPIFHPKVQKQLDSLRAKNDKLSEDNKALKQALSDFKTSHTRIRRIPKPE